MKKTIGIIKFSIFLFFAACSDQTKTTETAQPAPVETKKEIIIVQPAPTIIVKDPPAKSTTIILDKNGVKVGTKKVEIVLKRDTNK